MIADVNSIAAFESVKPDARTMRAKVFELVSQLPRTCDEIEAALSMSHQTASARLTELYRAKMVRRNGRRPTRSGRAAWVYEATMSVSEAYLMTPAESRTRIETAAPLASSHCQHDTETQGGAAFENESY